ncbi:MAG TPA: branched-chain amino acid ABC transporter substrate-binding protein [Aggregatilineaceae bacterium]|nr:branched-chain amino acid ABC transporter substrate-binding protein [Aggregatilineaceae bacterium]
MYRKLIVFALIGILVLTGCGDKDEPETKNQRVKIYVALPTDREVYQDAYNGILMAYEEAGKKAGTKPVELVFVKTSDAEAAYSTELEQQAANAAVKDKAVLVYIGMGTSGQARVGLPILNQAGLAGISLKATWPGLTKPGFGAGEPGVYYATGQRNFFRVVPSDDVQGLVGARWAAQLGFTNVFLVDDGSAYGKGVVGIFAANVQNIEIKGEAQFDYKTATPETYADIAQQVVTSKAEFVYFGGYAAEGGPELVAALHTAKPDIAIMGADAVALHDMKAQELGALVEGVYATDVIIPPQEIGNTAAPKFMEAYEAKYSEPATGMAMNGYDAMRLVLQVISTTSNPSRENILQGIHNLAVFSGTAGLWSFDELGDTTLTTISGYRFENGEWKFVQLLQ